MVAGLHLDDAAADFLDDAGALVAKHDRLRHRIDLIAYDHVGMAHAGRDDAHQHFVVARLLASRRCSRHERAALAGAQRRR